MTNAGRYQEIDALRGFALFGVLLVNLYSFGADSLAWDGTGDQLLWQIKHIFFESKFWGLFSLLFGISFWLQNREGTQFWRMCRRYLALMIFGLGNALLFEGDILMLYAELGIVLLVVHYLPDRALITLALALFLIFPLAHWADAKRGGSDSASSLMEAREWLEEDREEGLYSVGSLGDIVAEHASYLPEVPWEDYQWPDSGWAVLAFFLVGFVLARRGVLAGVARAPTQLLRRGAGLMMAGLAFMAMERFFAMTAGYDVYGDGLENAVLQLAGDLIFLVGTLSLTAAWFCLVLGLAIQYRGSGLVSALESAGRMSLTVYLSQTLVFTTLFYGYGLGWAYQLGPMAVSLLAVGIFTLQALFAHQWLRHFRLGPMEWLWRLATDLRIPSARAAPTPRQSH